MFEEFITFQYLDLQMIDMEFFYKGSRVYVNMRTIILNKKVETLGDFSDL